MAIVFTQYLRPNGKKRPVEITRPEEIETVAKKIIEAGGRFECEELMTGHAVFTVSFEVDGEPRDVAIQVCKNGPDVPDHVDKLVTQAAQWLIDYAGEGEKEL